MDGYKITKKEAEVLQGMTRADGSKYNPIVDEKGKYFIFETEHFETGLGSKSKYVPAPRVPIPEDTSKDKLTDEPEEVNDPKNKYESKK